jgi:hypothetical protein
MQGNRSGWSFFMTDDDCRGAQGQSQQLSENHRAQLSSSQFSPNTAGFPGYGGKALVPTHSMFSALSLFVQHGPRQARLPRPTQQPCTRPITHPISTLNSRPITLSTPQYPPTLLPLPSRPTKHAISETPPLIQPAPQVLWRSAQSTRAARGSPHPEPRPVPQRHGNEVIRQNIRDLMCVRQ